jgi:hypothetical protein
LCLALLCWNDWCDQCYDTNADGDTDADTNAKPAAPNTAATPNAAASPRSAGLRKFREIVKKDRLAACVSGKSVGNVSTLARQILSRI